MLLSKMHVSNSQCPSCVGVNVGEIVGDSVGESLVGDSVGEFVVGDCVGDVVGASVGESLVGD